VRRTPATAIAGRAGVARDTGYALAGRKPEPAHAFGKPGGLERLE